MQNITLEDALLFVQAPHRFVYALMRGIKPRQDINLNKTQIRTLLMLKELGPAAMRDLGSRIGMPKGSLTQVVDGLVLSGLVERYRDPADRRRVLVSVTESGLETTNKLDMNFKAHLVRMLKGLEDAEIREIIGALGTIRKTTLFFEEKIKNDANTNK